jgi:serine/threonine protein kinase
MPDQRFGLVADRYQLRDQLGRGGMGRVWLARDEALDRDVAIKEVAPPTNLSPEEAKQLRILIDREARAAARINHPNVVKIFDVLQTAEWPWLIMEYVPSESLQKVVQHEGPMPPVEVAKIGLAVLEALNAAHDANVLHRDVKPDNVLLADDGRVVLSDFGVATLDTDGKNTHSGRLGTPEYVAPERARHGISSREADLWSLGATIYAAVEGRSPYQRDSVFATLSALAVDPPDPMRLAGPLAPVISGLLQRDPAQRTHPDRLAAQLRAVISGDRLPLAATNLRPTPAPERLRPRDTPPAPTPSVSDAPRPRRRRVVAALAAAGLVTAAVVVGLVLAAGAEHQSPSAGGGTPSPSQAMSPLACENPGSQAAGIPVAPPPAGREPLAGGFVWYTDPRGFAVGVPHDWTYWRAGNTVCFRDPYGNRIMSIIPGRLTAETLPDYHLISTENIQMRGPATESEFTFSGVQRKRHAIALMTSGQTLLWVADDSDFSLSRPQYDLAKVSFDDRPRGGPGA